ncbi:MAG TPA: glycoside hydrolase family 25 protein [Bryobacteraceae bacterium]|nr:glycoside hydrolase family 25 protein [Bryobacteraceae bacterium]
MTGSNVIVDISHHNANVDLKKAKAAGIEAVIHKATQGAGFQDPAFAANRTKIKTAGLLFGAYHFGTAADPVRQADFFLKIVSPGPGDLLVLDFEENTQTNTMALEQARAFVSRVRDATGRFPGLYAGHFLKEQLGTKMDTLLRNCWLWHAQYSDEPKIHKNWKAWTMWQHTDGKLGPEPAPVDGIGPCDRDTFNGTLAELKAFWATASVPDPGGP